MRLATSGAAVVLTFLLSDCGAGGSPPARTSVFDARQQDQKIKQDRLREQIAAARSAQPKPRSSPTTAAAPSSGGGGRGRDLIGPTGQRSFAALERSLGGRSGVAAASYGATPERAGSWTSGVAWSSIKVPIALTAIRQGSADSGPLRAAITASDNGAAERLWAGLGTPAAAADAVDRTLRDASDATTHVQSTRTRPGFTSFGQTPWSLVSQARFAAKLPCLRGAETVLALMGQVVGDQRWGLGSAGVPARFKGGWGPDARGRYEVRQLGLLTLDGKAVGVAIANAPADGTFATGTANLTRIAAWTAQHVRPVGARSC